MARARPGHDGEGLRRHKKVCGVDDPANVPGSSSSPILPVHPEVGLDLGFSHVHSGDNDNNMPNFLSC